MEIFQDFLNHPIVRYTVLFSLFLLILFIVLYLLFYVKETDYIHPALYVKRNDFGLGVYTKEDIPANTVLVRKNIFHIDYESRVYKDYSDYIIQLIKKILQSPQKDEFLTFVPDYLDETTNVYDYNDIQDYHLKYLPQLDKNTMLLYYYKMTRNVFKYNEQAGVVFGYGTRFNHSCDFNVTYEIDSTVKQKNVMAFTTTRDINAGEELYITYVDTNEHPEVEERLTHLKDNYGFDCICPLCNSEEP